MTIRCDELEIGVIYHYAYPNGNIEDKRRTFEFTTLRYDETMGQWWVEYIHKDRGKVERLSQWSSGDNNWYVAELYPVINEVPI